MDLIADKDGVDVIISPVEKQDGFKVNLDFNFAKIKMHEMENRSKTWDVNLFTHKPEAAKREKIGRAKFRAFQFMADGVDRRTISLEYIEVDPKWRGQKKSYDMAEYIINIVKTVCDRDWGPVSGKPVLFIETKHIEHLPKEQRSSIFSFLKKIGEKVLGIHPSPQPIPDHDLVVTAIGDDISMQLIEGHLLRSDPQRDA